ncbi:MAG: thymidylate synthase, partial [Chloroflexota bacterium]
QGIRNLVTSHLIYPNIRFRIVVGADMSGSGKALRDWWQGEWELPDITLEAQDRIRRNVVFTFPETKGNRTDVITAAIAKELEKIKKFRYADHSEPEYFPLPAPKQELVKNLPLPSERTGFIARGDTIGETWLKVLDTTLKFGQLKDTHFDHNSAELYDVVAVISGNDKADFIPDYLPFSLADLENYLPQLLSGEKPEGVSYTYGSRLRNFKGVDQIAHIKAKLKREWFSRSAVACTWDATLDPVKGSSPCLVAIETGIQELDGSQALYVTVKFRSHDLFRAWPMNTYALRLLQQEIAESVGVAVGPLTIQSHSAHIYQDCFDQAALVVETNRKKQRFEKDPRGNFIITVEEDNLIHVRHSAEDTGLTGFEFVGRNAKELEKQLIASNLSVSFAHGVYLGRELHRAELARQAGIEFVQD